MTMSAEKDTLQEPSATVAFHAEDNSCGGETPEDVKGPTKPRVLEAILKGARACEELGLYEEAITWCKEGLAIDQQHKELTELRTNWIQRHLGSLNITDDKATGSVHVPPTAEQANGNATQVSKRMDTKAASQDPKAVDHSLRKLQEAREIFQQIGDKMKEGKACRCLTLALHNLGTTHGSIGNLQLALSYFNWHLSIAKAVGNRPQEGIAYNSIAETYFKLGDSMKTIQYYIWHLHVVKEVGDKDREGCICLKLGSLFYLVGYLKKAQDYFNKALVILQELGDKEDLAVAYNGLGKCHESMGDFRQAAEYHTMHLRTAQELKDRAGEGFAWGNLGIVSFRLGDARKAIDYHTLSLKIAKEVDDRYAEGQAYNNLGNAHNFLGEIRRGIQCHEAFLTIAKELKDRDAELGASTNLGCAYCGLCDFKKAIEYHENALSIAFELKNRVKQGQAYCNLGNCYYGLGDFKKAIDYQEQCKDLAEKSGDKAREGNAYCNLGNLHLSDGDLRSAVKNCTKALDIAEQKGDRALEERAHIGLGNASLKLGDLDQALNHYQQSLSIAIDVGSKRGQGQAYNNLGNVYMGRREYNQALWFFRQDLKIAEEIENAAGKAKSHYNQGLVHQILGDTNNALHSYQVSVTAFNEIRRQLQDKDEWKISIHNQHYYAIKALWTLLKGQGRTYEALHVLERGRAQALEDLIKLKYGLRESPSKENMINTIDIIRVSSNVFYAAVHDNEINMWFMQVGRPVVFTMKELDATTLQQTATANLESYVNLMHEMICPRKDRRCEDRSLDGLRDLKPSAEFQDEVASVPDKSSMDDGARSETPHEHFLKTLYEITVGELPDMKCGNELIIVPDGPLFKVPFAALIDSNSRYLCESFRIRVLPSLTTLKLILDAPVGCHSKKGALIIGDPCLKKIVRNGIPVMGQLPSAKEEAEMVGRILDTKPLIGQEATKNGVLKRLGNVALVHIAAHGRSETGEIALTPNPSRASEIPDERDFLLTMKEVLDVGLRAQLVVLSCCYSGRGEINTEGVVGIARAFLGAGARSVLVSLWAIDDKATKEFMACFYQNLVNGKSASEALNQAMNDMRESSKFGAVKYWAPFVLIGDDVRLEFDEDEMDHPKDD